MAEEGEGKRGHRPPQKRTAFIKIDDLNLDTPEGQDEMLKRMQIKLATENHNGLDLNAFKTLKDSVKVKTDLNVWMLFNRMQKRMDEWQAKQAAEEKEAPKYSTQNL